MFKKVLLIFGVLIIALNFIFLNLTNSALETQLLVDVSASSDNVPYTQTQWYGFNATAEQGYCAILTSLTGNSDAYLFDTDFNLVGFSKNSGTIEDKVWYGGSVSGPMHIACFGTDNPSSNFTIQVITAPYVKDLSPNSGSAGTLVTLTGLGFGATRGTSYVKFGTATATNYSSWTNTEIKVYVPSTVAGGKIQVVVYVSSKASNPIDFTATGVSSDGTMWRYDLARTGKYPDGPTTLPLNLKWSYAYPTGIFIRSLATVADNIVYIGSNKLYALDADTGSLKWSYATDGGIASSPAVAGGIVYVGSGYGRFYALDAITGSLKWRYDGAYPYTIYSSPAVVNNTVYFSAGVKFYALDANNGTLKWSYAVASNSNYISYSFAIANGLIYFGDAQGKIYALYASDGAVKWIYNLPFEYINGTPAVANGILYFSATNRAFGGELYALDADTGSVKWQYRTYYWSQTPAIANGVIYFSDSNGALNAFDATTGKYKWGVLGGGSAPIVSNGLIYSVRARDGKLYVFDANTGSLKWSPNILGFGGEDNYPPLVANGRVYIASWYDKKFYCFGE